MRRGAWYGVTPAVALVVLVACAQPAEEGGSEEAAVTAETTAAPAEEQLPDPELEEAQEVEGFVRQWVADRAEDGVYDIPARGDHDVSGALVGFHTVHQKDSDTYSVCVDFQSGDDTYDVDFFVDRAEEGLSLADHWLHKINSEAVE